MRKRNRLGNASKRANRTERTSLLGLVVAFFPMVSKRPILLVPLIAILLTASFFDRVPSFDLVASAPASMPFTVAYISDGDTLSVYGESHEKLRIRLAGIDAPESDQPGGLESKAHLMELLPKGTRIQLDEQSKDRYGRTVAVIRRGAMDINHEQIRNGHAWVYRQYNNSPEYLEAEHIARSLLKGLWAQAAPIAPWEWRRQKRNKQAQ